MDYNAFADSMVQAIYGSIGNMIVCAAPFVIVGFLVLLAKRAFNSIIKFFIKKLS